MKKLIVGIVIFLVPQCIAVFSNCSLVYSKPGRILIDKNGFRYIEWPFTFAGLTIGKPIDDLKQVGALFPKSEKEALVKVEKYLMAKKLNVLDIPVHQSQIWSPELREIQLDKLGSEYVERYLSKFINFLGLGGFDYGKVSVQLTCESGTPIILSIGIREPAKQVLISLPILKKTLGEPDLVLPPYDGNTIHNWKNLNVRIHDNNVKNIWLTACSPMAIGPKPKSERHFSVGWLMPWDLLMKMAKQPEQYEMLRIELKKRGVEWKDEHKLQINLFANIFFGRDPLALKYSDPGGFTGSNGDKLAKELDPLMEYLFPNKRVPVAEFGKGFFGIIQSFSPGIIDSVMLSFAKGVAMSRKDFENIYGKANKTIEASVSKGKLLETYYLREKIEAIFIDDHLVMFSLNSKPIIFPPPKK